MITFVETEILATCLQAILYGFSVLLFTLTIWLLVWNRNGRPVNVLMITAACALLILSTGEMAVNIARLYHAFSSIETNILGGPTAYLVDVSHASWIVKCTIYTAQTLIYDAVVTYRAYVIWKSLLVVVLPILGWIGILVTGILANVSYGLRNTPHAISVKTTRHYVTALCVMTLVTNLFSTLLLAYKVWKVSHESAKFRMSARVTPILSTIIESGAIYSLTLTAGLITFLLHTPAVQIVLDMISPVICIAFNMIIVRIGLSNEKKASSDTETANGAPPPTPYTTGPPHRARRQATLDRARVRASQESKYLAEHSFASRGPTASTLSISQVSDADEKHAGGATSVESYDEVELCAGAPLRQC